MNKASFLFQDVVDRSEDLLGVLVFRVEFDSLCQIFFRLLEVFVGFRFLGVVFIRLGSSDRGSGL